MPEPNPFESPASAGLPVAAERKRVWWHRLIPTAVFGMLGSSSLSLGLMLAISLGKSLAAGDQPRGWWYVSMVIFLWTGTAWVLASWLFLKKRPGWGAIAAVIGFAIPLGWEIFIRAWSAAVR